MKNVRIIRIALFLLALSTVGVAQTQDWRTNRQARTVVDRLITRANTFQREIDRNRYSWDTGSNNDDRLSTMVSAFSNALSSLRTSLRTNDDAADELDGVLTRASRISIFVNRNRLNTRAQYQWTSIRSDVNTLAGYYNLSWNWNEPYNRRGDYGNSFPDGRMGGRRDLTGTYRLNTSMSDNVESVIDRSAAYYANDQRDRMRRGLQRRLRAPEMIAIDKNGRTISMSSSLQPQVTFDADGIARTETNARGRTITTTVTPANRGFTVNYTGDRMSDFNVAFDIDGDGRLRVTRRIYLENRNETVSTLSVYDRINDAADWSAVVQEPRVPWNGNTTSSSNEFYVPNGVVLTAQLRDSVNTRASQVGDRFSLEVTSPNEFRGAVIDGHVTEAANSGRVSGRARLQLDLDTITVNGRQYAFAGIIQSVAAANGDSVTVSNEGTIRDNSQTSKTVTRAGVGAVLGAVIGAIAGGGQGAAIGATVGAGAGAGSVLVGGRDNIELGTGSMLTITASAPANAAYIRR